MTIREAALEVETYCNIIRQANDEDIKELIRMDGDKLIRHCSDLCQKIKKFKKLETSKGDQ